MHHYGFLSSRQLISINAICFRPEEPLDELDEILKKPVQNKTTVINAIKVSTTRTQYFTSNTVQQVIDTYPYLKHADLVIHYDLREFAF
jgi:hypothetical protein